MAIEGLFCIKKTINLYVKSLLYFKSTNFLEKSIEYMILGFLKALKGSLYDYEFIKNCFCRKFIFQKHESYKLLKIKKAYQVR